MRHHVHSPPEAFPAKAAALAERRGSKPPGAAQAILDALPDALLGVGSEMRILWTNGPACLALGLPNPPPLPIDLSQLFGPHNDVERRLRSLSPKDTATLDVPFAGFRQLPGGARLCLCALPDSASPYAYLIRVLPNPPAGTWLRSAPTNARDQDLKTIAFGFAHELKNPLAGMRGLSDLLSLDSLDRELERECVRRLAGLIDRLDVLTRAFVRVGIARPPEPQVLEPRVVVTDALTRSRARWPGGTPQVFLPTEEPPLVEVDLEQLVDSLTELIVNALEAAEDAERVAIRVLVGPMVETCKGPARTVVFEVRDDGPGIAPVNLDRVFEPFFSTKAHNPGLGLTLASRLVRANGGWLTVSSAPHEETIFRLALPEAVP